MDPRPRRSKIEKVRLDSLRVPPAGKAQRPFRQSKGDEIAGHFDIDSFGFPVVCRVEGVNWLVDGQHRVYAIQQSGYAVSTDEIECEVYQLGIPEEVEHGIRRKWNIDSGGSGTANPGSGTRNPEEVEHRFRRKWNSGSGGRERSSVA